MEADKQVYSEYASPSSDAFAVSISGIGKTRVPDPTAQEHASTVGGMGTRKKTVTQKQGAGCAKKTVLKVRGITFPEVVNARPLNHFSSICRNNQRPPSFRYS